MNRAFAIILATVLLDVIGLGIVIPILPFIVKGFGFSEFYVGLTYSIFSLGMFVGGLTFGRLSDKLGRNKTLEFTIFLNIVGYLLFAFSTNLYVFLIARFIGGLGASGFAIGQAYISDISSNEERTKNMAMVGAMFGIGFMIGPVLGGFFSNFSDNLNLLGYISATVAFLNLLSVMFFLPKVKQKTVGILQEKKFTINNPLILVLLAVSFITALGFSAMQSTFALVMSDRFSLDSKQVGYLLGYVGLVAIIYQAKLIKYVRNALGEVKMIIFGLSFLILGFLLFSINTYYIAIYFIIFMFPIGNGTITPTIASMQSKLGNNHVGKLLGINSSMISLGNIVGPFIAGALYIKWSGLPYVFSSILFIIALVLIIFKMKEYSNVGKTHF
ncbi:MAG: MFS transporter [Candidatus Gracilibacteria bacterium]|nr:MFS transporter [Candidatus Gracilibacteria bacterium]